METNVKYQELINGQTKLQGIGDNLGNASEKLKKITFNTKEIGGSTAGQAVYGFASIYDQLISEMTSLVFHTVEFLADVGIVFGMADEAAAKEIEK